MIEIKKQLEGQRLTLYMAGRLDTAAAPKLEKIVVKELEGVTELVLDFQELFYVSSAGLRALLLAQKQMDGRGEMFLLHVNEDVKEILQVTGFAKILTIKEDSQEK